MTTRLSQALAKQAKEVIKICSKSRKPRLQKHTVTLCSHFVRIEPFKTDGNKVFDYVLKLIGSGAPNMVIPFKGTEHLNGFLTDGWIIGKTIRMGQKEGRVFIDLILEKAKPAKKESGKTVGMDSNYKNGLVFSDGQIIGKKAYEQIQTFGRREKHTHEQIKSFMGEELKKLDLSGIKVLCIENLKNVKNGTRGKFPRRLNRRLSHWMYSYIMDLIRRKCEESGVRLEGKSPWKTSQFCRICGKWDKRNRRGDKFVCVHCGHSDHADFNAAKNLEFLGLAGVYSLRLLKKPEMS